MTLIQVDFDRNSVDMASMVPNRLVNRIRVSISNDNDLLLGQLVGMWMYSMDMLDNLWIHRLAVLPKMNCVDIPDMELDPIIFEELNYVFV